MNPEEAIRACWWTTNVAETVALGQTENPKAAEFFGALNDQDEYQPEQWSNPDRRGWAIKVPRWLASEVLEGAKIENFLYQQIAAEIERRRGA